MNELTHLAADGNGEFPGDVEDAAASLPWVCSEDQLSWTADLGDGRAASVEVLDDGCSFLPRVGDAVGPVCSGRVPAAAWAVRFAAVAQ